MFNALLRIAFPRRLRPRFFITFLISEAIDGDIILAGRKCSREDTLLEEIGFGLLEGTNSKCKKYYLNLHECGKVKARFIILTQLK